MIQVISRGTKNGRPAAQVVLKMGSAKQKKQTSRTMHMVYSYEHKAFMCSRGALHLDVPLKP